MHRPYTVPTRTVAVTAFLKLPARRPPRNPGSRISENSSIRPKIGSINMKSIETGVSKKIIDITRMPDHREP